MALTGDDLPAAGAQQVICACMGEGFKVILNAGIEIVAECLGCGSTANRWPTLAGLGPLGEYTGPGRDTLPAANAGVQVSAAWVGEPDPPGPPTAAEQAAGRDTEEQIRKVMGLPPPLPSYSAEMRNAFLMGGPYDGQETWIMDADSGGEDFHIAGVASYTNSGRVSVRGGDRKPLAIYVHVPPPAP